MKEFSLKIVAPKRRRSDSEKAQGRMLFRVLENGEFLVGVSVSHSQLWQDHLLNNGLVQLGEPFTFAQGSCEGGQLLFDNETPGWKRDEIREFLAGQALLMAVTNAAHDRFLNQALAATT
ncbi:MAG: hypothetical protein AAB899_00170 [Patescibacteria group bacterium]